MEGLELLRPAAEVTVCVCCSRYAPGGLAQLLSSRCASLTSLVTPGTKYSHLLAVQPQEGSSPSELTRYNGVLFGLYDHYPRCRCQFIAHSRYVSGHSYLYSLL